MPDEKEPENTSESGTGGEATQEEEKLSAGAQARIDALTKKNAELEDLVNVRNRIEELERGQAQLAGKPAEEKLDPDEEKWIGFLAPKVNRLLRERDQVLFALADEADDLKTQIAFPEYADPELRNQVKKIRDQRMRETNGKVILSRGDIITYLNGLPENRKKEIEKEVTKVKKQTPTVSDQGIGRSRAETPAMPSLTKEELEAMSWDDIEKKVPLDRILVP